MPLKIEAIPEKAIIVRRGTTIVAASWFGPWVERPYIHPFLAPGDQEATRLGHPGDPVGHSHHRGIWIGHQDVGGVNFWEESQQSGRIIQEEILEQKPEGDTVGLLLENTWRTPAGKILLREKRRLTFSDLPDQELALDLDIELKADEAPVVLGKSNFGLLGIRVARTLRPLEGLGGSILNSEEAENESACFGQHAQWIDCSGPVLALIPAPAQPGGSKAPPPPPRLGSAIIGITCWDHPSNSEEGTQWHVRDDGWFGPGFTRSAPRTATRDKALRARYRILAHGGRAEEARIADRFRDWRKSAAK